MTFLIKLTPQLLAFVFKFVFFNDQFALKRFYFLVLVLLHSIKLPQPRLNNLQKQYAQLHKIKHIIQIKIRHDMRLQNLFQKFIQLECIAIQNNFRRQLDVELTVGRYVVEVLLLGKQYLLRILLNNQVRQQVMPVLQVVQDLN